MPRWVTQLDFDLAIAEIPSGPPGPQGVQGDPGTNGTDGGIGPIGPVGPIGPIGETGEVGATGSQGIQGQTGNTGQTGNQGIQGIQGVPGETGATGADGPQGIPGVDGTDGSDGAEGEQGIQGIQGIQGTQGIPGVPGTTLHSGLTDVTADQHHVSFVAADHAALPNPHHANANDPSAGQKAGLAGTTGTPGDANRYVTDTDARNTNARTPTSHSHPESEVTNLVSDLAGKSAVGHAHAESDVTNLVSDLAGKAASTHNILTAHNGFPGGTTTYLRADGSFATPAGGGSFSATTVEVNLATVATWRGTFTITDAVIGPTSKVLCWQAPGPYTGKGTRADEAEAAPVQVIAVAPASGSAKVYWRSVEGFAPLGPGASDVGGDQTGAATLVRHGHPAAPPPLRVIGKVRGNFKFSYVVG